MAKLIPTRSQRLFASPWLMRVWYSATTLPTTAICLALSGFRLEHLADWSELRRFVLIGAASALFGLLLGVFPGLLVLSPLFQSRARLNGAPFCEGDMVQVLSGPHRGTKARVYGTWQGDTVRVELGASAHKHFKDIFSPVELLRVPDAPPVPVEGARGVGKDLSGP